MIKVSHSDRTFTMHPQTRRMLSWALDSGTDEMVELSNERSRATVKLLIRPGPFLPGQIAVRAGSSKDPTLCLQPFLSSTGQSIMC
jgi:hypothetical protein